MGVAFVVIPFRLKYIKTENKIYKLSEEIEDMQHLYIILTGYIFTIAVKWSAGGFLRWEEENCIFDKVSN